VCQVPTVCLFGRPSRLRLRTVCATVSMRDLERETEASGYALVLSCLLDLEGRQLEELVPPSVETEAEVA
jgi:hypothetical protein